MCTEYSSQDDLEFISSFCTEELSQANLAVICRLVTRMTPLQWGATHSMIRCRTMCEESAIKTYIENEIEHVCVWKGMQRRAMFSKAKQCTIMQNRRLETGTA